MTAPLPNAPDPCDYDDALPQCARCGSQNVDVQMVCIREASWSEYDGGAPAEFADRARCVECGETWEVE